MSNTASTFAPAAPAAEPHRRLNRRYRVWAPRAERVLLAIEGARLSMTRGVDGWWTADRPMHDGELYAYIVDDEGPFPDPRSTFQPSGVHGWSQCVDHSLFEWTDAQWQPPPLASGIVYELHIGTFSESGTFEGAIAKLPYLAELGVTHLELMPVCEFSGSRGGGTTGSTCSLRCTPVFEIYSPLRNVSRVASHPWRCRLGNGWTNNIHTRL